MGSLIKGLFGLLLLSALSYGQLPLNYSEENTGKGIAVTAGALSKNQYLPDPFSFTSGGRVATTADWSKRRNEIRADIEKYEIGTKPAKPADVTATYSGGQMTVTVKENGKTVTLTSKFSIPSGTGPHPIVIGMNSGTGSLPASLFSGVAQVPFNHDQVAKYAMTGTKDLNAPFYKMYSDLSKAGDYNAWSWGVSRIIDGLALIAKAQNLDMGRIAVTGCSYAGKMALFAGAFDERITLTIAQESGGGGINSWRLSDAFAKRVENVEKIDNTNYSWFMQSMKSLDPYSLPHDHHELIAMIAPRAFLAFGNPGYVWLGDESGYKSVMAAMEVWKAMQIEDRFGFDFSGGHEHCQAASTQSAAAGAFIDKFLRQKTTVNTKIRVTPANSKFNLDYASAINWTTPTLTSSPDAPKVTITSPKETRFDAPATIQIVATASAPAGSVSKVEFFSGDKLLASITASPYSYTWKDVEKGIYAVKAVVTDSKGGTGQDLVSIDVQGPRVPYGGVAWTIPGKIEFEHFDEGGNGVAYLDNTPGSETNVDFRSDEEVDIEVCKDEGSGYNLGYTTAGEWLEYTVNVASAGVYSLEVRAAVKGDGRFFKLESNGKVLAPKIEIPDTGDWQIWKTFKVDGLSLQAGKQVLRATIGDTDYLNLNYMIFSLEESNSLSVDNSRPFQISIKEGHLKVQGAETTTHIRVHDLRGRLVAEFGSNGGKLPNTAKGVLLVSLVSANNATSHYKMKNLQ